MTYAERQELINTRPPEDRPQQRQANNANTNQAGDDSSTIAGPPTTVDIGHRQVHQANQHTNQHDNQQQTRQSTQNQAPGSMLRNMMSNASARSAQAPNDEISINGTIYRRANRANLQYKVSKGEVTPTRGALVDGGANGFMLGDDCVTLETVAHASCDVTGIADQTLTLWTLPKVLLMLKLLMMDL